MMNRLSSAVLLGLTVLAVSGCVSQEQADNKMGKGCEAGLSAMIAPKTLKTIKSVKFADEKNSDGTYRRVTIAAVEKDGWMELDKEYSCLFLQQWGFFKSSHIALLEQLNYNGKVLGKLDGKIIGSMEDYMKLTKSADTAMGQ